jgi:hypothetical protein
LATINNSAPRTLTSLGKSYFRDSVAGNLMEASDADERDPKGLNRATLRGLFVSPLERWLLDPAKKLRKRIGRWGDSADRIAGELPIDSQLRDLPNGIEGLPSFGRFV